MLFDARMKSKKKENPSLPATLVERFEGATDEQLREAEEVTGHTEYSARYVGPGEGQGCPWKCQIGKYFHDSGTVTHREPGGQVVTERWVDGSIFHLLGFGATFTEAMVMVRKTVDAAA